MIGKLTRAFQAAALVGGLALTIAARAEESVLLGASTPGHSAYNIVVAYSQAIRSHEPSLDVTVQASGGSIDAIQFLQAKRVHAVPVGASAPYDAYKGLARWDGAPVKSIRTWLPMYSWGAQLVVPVDSPIQSWTDLRGKRVGVGPIGSAGEGINRNVLTAVGLTYDDIDEFRIPHGESVDGIKSGMLDAFIETTGFPTPGITEAMASMNLRLVANTADELKKATDANPLYSVGKIPAGTYPQLESDMDLVVGYTIMVIDEAVSEDTVYTMTKAIWENLDDIRASHASQRLLQPSMIEPALMPVAPIHPGALRYYREQGWIN